MRTGRCRHRKLKSMFWRASGLLSLPLALWPTMASGQSMEIGDSIIVNPVLPYDYDQDRNVSLRQQLTRDYGPLGIRAGAFLLFPRVEAGVGASDNVSLSPQDEQADVLLRLSPSLDLRSDWARHQLDLSASASFYRHADQAHLDRDTWDIGAQGRLDVGDFGALSAETRMSQVQEEPFSSGIDAEQALLSRYRRHFVAIRGSREIGRTRLSATAAYSNIEFSDLDFGGGVSVSQSGRDRDQLTLAVQGEYAFSPGAVAYAQLSRVDTHFKVAGTPINPAQDAQTWRLMGGFNADLPGKLRGTVAVGYLRRTVDQSTEPAIDGFSAEAEVTYFHDTRTNFTLSARRLLQDAPTWSGQAYFDTSLRFTAERAVGRNVLLSAGGYLGVIDEVRSPVRYDVQQVNAGAEYFAPRWFSVRLSAAYSKRDGKGTAYPSDVDEMSALLTLTFHP